MFTQQGIRFAAMEGTTVPVVPSSTMLSISRFCEGSQHRPRRTGAFRCRYRRVQDPVSSFKISQYAQTPLHEFGFGPVLSTQANLVPLGLCSKLARCFGAHIIAGTAFLTIWCNVSLEILRRKDHDSIGQDGFECMFYLFGAVPGSS